MIMNIVSDTFIDLLITQFFREEKFIRTTRINNDWIEVNRQIRIDEIYAHFNGEYYIGFICRNTATGLLVFDLDSHSSKTEQTLVKRVGKVSRSFGNPDFIYSSPNKGLHLYYFLDKYYYPDEIKKAVNLKIKICPGELEIFPNGKGLRLFGGRDCRLLDNNLKPIELCFEEYIINTWEENEKLNLCSLSRYRTKTKYDQACITRCEILLDSGLDRPSTRNSALLDLNRYFQGFLELSPTETEKRLVEWMATKNNGFSKEWNINPKGVIKKINSMVSGYDKNKDKGGGRLYFPIHVLTSSDKKRIREIAIKISKNTDIAQKSYEDFMLDIISYSKYHQTDGIVEIPRNVFQGCKNGSGDRYIKFKQPLKSHKILLQVKNYDATRHKCKVYRLSDNFI
jgi:hypothetical protein